MLIKVVVILMLVAILASLFSALVFLFRDQGRGERTARALTWRIGLSITLFVLLMAGFYFGIIPPQGLSAPGQ
ncbi:MAG: twin transmembrane helix small protein [Pseudomonadota bacterium]|nr:MAG: twin transmembrane helix small protein [Pseudomonadota bacterium]